MSVKMSRILHAGYVFECEDLQIAFDPIFENPFSHNCYAFPNVKFDHAQIKQLWFEAVFISHFHDDHCSMESLNLLNRETPIYVYCQFEEIFSLLRELGFSKVYSLRIDEGVTVGPFEVIPRRALDSHVDSLFQIKAAGVNILNVVDSQIDETTIHQLVQESPWDVVLWPFQTLLETDVIAPSRSLPASKNLPSEWLEQLTSLNPRYIVPSSCQFLQESWSWYNHALFPISYRQFQQELESSLPKTQVVRMNPSVSYFLTRNALTSAEPLKWISPVGEQSVDYDYRPEIKPPSTAETARRFKPLTAEQNARVLQYCAEEILEKYHSLDEPEDDYFRKQRIWRLALYDHAGQRTIFHFRLKGTKIEKIDPTEELSWLTEVPIAKVYAALEHGEALTSMYMRVNDSVFSDQVEKEIKYADVLEDPLIRCLFTGRVLAYQNAQMRRLRQTL